MIVQQSPFGALAPIVAAVTAVAVIGAFIVATLLDNVSAAAALQDPFWVAIGVAIGGATAVPAINGHVAQQASAANRRLDAAGIPAADATAPASTPHT